MNIDSLREQFDELGVDPSTEVLEKCRDIEYIILSDVSYFSFLFRH